MLDQDALTDQPNQLAAAIFKALVTLHILAQQIGELKRVGTVNAAIYYRDGKYAYLIYPTAEDGSRRRSYVGIDPSRIAMAKAAISRHTQLVDLSEKHRQLEHKLDQTFYQVQTLIHSLNNGDK